MLKTCLAIGTGKAVAEVVARLHLGAGTSLPGKLARRIDPKLLTHLGAQIKEQIIAVTGTNGKTTTCGLLAQMLREAGRRVVHNQLGANMVPGITAALLRQSSIDGRLSADVGVLEVDEASLKGVTSEINVQRVLVTNLFRDQLDRYGELDTTAKMIQAGICQQASGQQVSGQTNLSSSPPHAHETSRRVILNADDPLVAGLGLKHSAEQVAYFGIREVTYQHPLPTVDAEIVFPHEASSCPACGSDLKYDQNIYGHLGHYHCASCAYARPQPTVEATRVVIRPDASEVTISANGQVLTVTLSLPGLFNVYNFLAAAAVVVDMGLPLSVAEPALNHYHSVFGRAEKKIINGKSVMVMLIKNPVGASEVIKLVAGDPKGRLLVALNDNYADGRDVSWIWDAQFELFAAQEHQKTIVVSGVRAEDMAVRLKYAGVAPERLLVIGDLKQAVEKAIALTQPDETLYVMPTYTVLLSLRNIL